MAVALLVAAGSGERLGAGRPKAFVELAGRPMLAWSLEAMRAAGIGEIVVAPRTMPQTMAQAITDAKTMTRVLSMSPSSAINLRAGLEFGVSSELCGRRPTKLPPP